MNDGKDYVFTVKDDSVIKKYIEIEDVLENKVVVRGVSRDEVIVTEGLKSLKEGDKIKILSKVE